MRTRISSVIGVLYAFGLIWPVLAPTSTSAQIQSKPQQKCISQLNKGGAKVAQTQGKENAACVKNAGKGKLPAGQTAEACLTADNKGKISKARTKNSGGETKKCTPLATPPDFGVTSAATGNSAAVTEKVNLTHDVFGADLDSAIQTDKAGSGCQAAVVKGYEKLAVVKLKQFLVCKKNGLSGKVTPQITSTTDLEGCLSGRSDSIASDPKQKIGKALTKLEGAVAKKCPAGVPNSAFPGACTLSSGAVGFAACLDERVECRICLLLNTIDALNVDCDLFDDGVDNDSCQAGPPPTTTTTTLISTTTTTTVTTSTTVSSSTTTTTVSSTTTTTLPSVPPLDHFKVYNAAGPDGPPVHLVDQFDVEDVDLGPLVWLLPPTSKNGGGIVDPVDHLGCYQVPQGTFGPVLVDVDNQFGPQTLTVKDPVALCVPSEKSLGPLPPDPAILLRDHYKCYNAVGEVPPVPPVLLQDQFKTESVPIGPPLFFCNPVDKNGEGIRNDVDHLTCYAIDGAPFGIPANIRNQFHPGGAPIDVASPFALCVPSLKLAVTPTTTTTTTSTTTTQPTITTTTTSTTTTTVTVTTTTTTTTLSPPPPLDHFKVYGADGPPGPFVHLEDQFDIEDVPLGPAIWFMPPVDKNSEGIIDPVDHLTCYGIEQPGSGLRAVDIENQFGPQQLLVDNPIALCVPTEKSHLVPLPPDPAILLRDHYKCYNASGPPVELPVDLQDQFDQGPQPNFVHDPFAFCNPVNKNFEGIRDPSMENHLACYRIDPMPFPPPPIFIRNQFYGDIEIQVFDAFGLCVPSTKFGWTTTTTTSTTTTTTIVPLDHFKMYSASGFQVPPPVSLADQFTFEMATLGQLVLFMPPVDKNSEGIIDPVDHLTCYAIEQAFFGPVSVQVDNQFGPQDLTVNNPVALCVPSEKSHLVPLPPDPAILLRDHYKCYEATGPAIELPVTLQDQFDPGPEPNTVHDPVLFCNPVDKNGEGIKDLGPDNHLTCYNIDPGLPPPPPIFYRNQFFDEDEAIVNDPVGLCVPSTKLGWFPLAP